jgi:heme exporter protein A
MSDARPLLRAKNLTKHFGPLYALRSLSLDVEAGRFLTIFGRNGAGKTTFLKIASSLIRSYEGEAFLNDVNLKQADEKTRGRIGFLSHESYLYKDLSVRDNLLFYGKMYHLDMTKKQIDALIAEVGLSEKIDTSVRHLSRGMRQRAAIAKVFLHDPALLLLDEPYTGLDEQACEVLDVFLEAFHSRGGTVILTTHQLERGLKHADHIVVFDKGTIAYQATAGTIDAASIRQTYRDIVMPEGSSSY